MGLTVVTYGGGEVLKNVFDAIAMLMHGKSGGLLHPICVICGSIGGFIAVSKALLSGAAEQLISRFALPFIAIAGLLCVPTTTLRVEDVLKDRSYTISHVPLFLARFAELASSIGYQLTVALEKVMHVPQEISYNKTGMIFGADTYLSLGRYQINDADLEHNLRRFCKQCVLYDIALGRYSVEELKKSTDLWKFLTDHTSKTRMVQYTPPGQKSTPKTTRLLTCEEAMKAMAPFFECAKGFYSKQELFRCLPLTFQALTGIQQEQEGLIGQQLMMQVLTDEYSGSEFAAARAHAQQRSTYEVMGALAGKSLVVMRIVLEALIYASFIFVLPMTLLPHGLKFLSSWMWLTVWIQLWPPFYSTLNYIMQTVAQSQSSGLFGGLQSCQCGLSLFTSAGLRSLNADIYALSGYLAASIPFLSWAILKGGVGSFIHLAGAMMTPAHAASTSAGAEQATGNYSLANASYGNLSYQNATAMQENYAPSLSTGYVTTNDGSSSMTFAAQETMLRQANSDLRTNIFGDASSSWASQHACQAAESIVDSHQKSFAQSVATHGREIADFSSHVSEGMNFGTSHSTREAYEMQESARYFESLAENLSEQHGFSQRESLDLLMSGGVAGRLGLNLGVCRFGTDMESKLSSHRTSSRDDILNSVETLSSGEDFQAHFQKIQGGTKGESFNQLGDEGKRIALGVNRSFDDVMNAQRAHTISKQFSTQLTDSLTESDNVSLAQRDNLNQEFVEWAQNRYADWGGASRVDTILRSGSSQEKGDLVGEFVEHKRSEAIRPSSGYMRGQFRDENNRPSESWSKQVGAVEAWAESGFGRSTLDTQASVDPAIDAGMQAHFEMRREEIVLDAQKKNLVEGKVAGKGEGVQHSYEGKQNMVGAHLPKEEQSRERVGERYESESERIDEQLQRRGDRALVVGALKGVERKGGGVIANVSKEPPPLVAKHVGHPRIQMEQSVADLRLSRPKRRKG